MNGYEATFGFAREIARSRDLTESEFDKILNNQTHDFPAFGNPTNPAVAMTLISTS